MCHIMAQVGSAVERGQTQKSQGGNHPGFFCEYLAFKPVRTRLGAPLSGLFSEKSADLLDAGPDCHGDRHAHHHAHLRG